MKIWFVFPPLTSFLLLSSLNTYRGSWTWSQASWASYYTGSQLISGSGISWWWSVWNCPRSEFFPPSPCKIACWILDIMLNKKNQSKNVVTRNFLKCKCRLEGILHLVFLSMYHPIFQSAIYLVLKTWKLFHPYRHIKTWPFSLVILGDLKKN